MKLFKRVFFVISLAVLGASWSQTVLAAGADVRVYGTYNGVDVAAYRQFSSLELNSPQSFVSTGVHFTATGSPLPAMSLEVSNMNSINSTSSHIWASAVFGYTFEIFGPVSASVPLVFSGTYSGDYSNGNWGTNTIVNYRVADDAAGGFQCGRDFNSGCGHGTFGGTILVKSNYEYPVYLYLDIGAFAQDVDSTSASASIDPYLYIDPTWAADHPGYSLSVFGVGNSVPAVPEPETYAMMLAGLGLLGMMARRRRQGR